VEKIPLFKKKKKKKNILGIYDATYKVVIFGDAGCGKTTLTQRFLGGLPRWDLGILIPIDLIKSMEINGKKVKLHLWDFGGEERFRFLLPIYIRGANGAIFMYDVTNYTSLDNIDDWLLVINQIKSEQGNFPIIAVGGKADLVGFREVTREEGINVAKSRGLQGFIECSSKSGVNVEETFEGLTRIMMSLESEKWDRPYCMRCGRAVPKGLPFCYACGGKVTMKSVFTFF